ncbi:hypothetical protein [Paenimyroides aestuarii]|uniref:Uncharacterized protein n=1 Tax=Paenimyroides aestuarii TaxID=2968490 RepID=A0ABY5NPZ1_9FLAO|nr:hypothetical protein [Paenimyroides aestuarii]UUV20489.1 hypothetical protein NPX36_08930 [Paenimyroides aestuarii]
MKKSVLILIATMFAHTNLSFAQIGINKNTPQATLDIVAANQANPSNTSGIIIPRVSVLNTTDTKEKGLLVFLNVADSTQRGFYWWDGVQWNPFLSLSNVTNNKSITYVSTKSTFKEGNMTEDVATNDRTLEFDEINTNDTPSFELNAAGELVVKKSGYFHVQAASFIRKNSGTTQNKRDQLDMKIYVNGVDASIDNSANFNIEGTKAYPIGFFTIAINAAGVLKLDANDRLSMKIIRSYRDAQDDPAGHIIIPDPNAKSNITLRFMGDF